MPKKWHKVQNVLKKIPPKSTKLRHYSLYQNSGKFCKDFTPDRIFFTPTVLARWYVFASLHPCTILFIPVLYCTFLGYTVNPCTVLYIPVLYCTPLYCSVHSCTVLYITVLYCTSLYYTVNPCSVLYILMLYCTSLYCTVHLMYCTSLYCTVHSCTV